MLQADLGGVLCDLKRSDEGNAWCKKAIESDPTCALAYYNLGSTHLDEGAWTLLTNDIEELRDPARALGFARRACTLEEAAGGKELWSYLDTLALAQHRSGDTGAAVQTQRRAISLIPKENGDPDMPKRLAEYEAALRSAEAPHDKGGPQ